MARILFRGATVVDGSGEAARRADVLVDGERIAAVAPSLEVEDAELIDVSGRILSPGFIDIHRHCDAQPLYDDPNYGRTMLRQGISTTVVGNCGISYAPLTRRSIEAHKCQVDAPVLGDYFPTEPISFPAYLDALDRSALPVNYLAMPGIGTTQIAVNGYAMTIGEDEIRQVQALLDEALRAGAPGVSLGIMYIPESYRSSDEIVAMLEPLRGSDKLITTHIRGEGDSLVRSVEEVIEIARRVGCRLEISHFKAGGKRNWGRSIHEAIAIIERAQAEGQAIGVDVYPYDAGSTSLNTMIPPAYIDGDMGSALARMATPDGVEALKRSLEQTHPGWDNFAISLGWERILLSGLKRPENLRFIGLTVAEAAERYGYAHAVDLVAELMVSEDGVVAIINQSMSQDDVDVVVRLPYASFISDSIYANTERPHPRLHGSMPRFIHDYVYKRGVLRLEEAIMKMTSQPARVMRIPQRGRIAEGYYADINVFSADSFRDRATFLEPAREAEGLELALVNGQLVVKQGEIQALDRGVLVRV